MADLELTPQERPRRRPLPGGPDSRQGSLFQLQATLPPRKTTADVPQKCPQDLPLWARNDDPTRQATLVASPGRSSNLEPPSASDGYDADEEIPDEASVYEDEAPEDELDEDIPIGSGYTTETGDYIEHGETKPAYRMTLEESTASLRRQYPGGRLPNGMTTSDEDCKLLWDACRHAHEVVMRREAKRGNVCRECGDPLPPLAKACPNCYTRIEGR